MLFNLRVDSAIESTKFKKKWRLLGYFRCIKHSVLSLSNLLRGNRATNMPYRFHPKLVIDVGENKNLSRKLLLETSPGNLTKIDLDLDDSELKSENIDKFYF